MSKLDSSLKNMVVTLFVIAVVAGLALGYVYQKTKEPIEIASQEKQQNAIKMVVPEFDNNPAEEAYNLTADNGQILTVFPAKVNNELVAVAIETYSNNGFAGEVRIMVGFKTDGTIIDYQVLALQETPGLGTKMTDWFKPRVVQEGKKRSKFFDFIYGIKETSGGDANNIVGKNPGNMKFTVSKDGGDVDAITAATISSRSFLESVNIAYNTYINSVENNQQVEKTDEQQVDEQEEGGEL